MPCARQHLISSRLPAWTPSVDTNYSHPMGHLDWSNDWRRHRDRGAGKAILHVRGLWRIECNDAMKIGKDKRSTQKAMREIDRRNTCSHCCIGGKIGGRERDGRSRIHSVQPSEDSQEMRIVMEPSHNISEHC